MKPWLDRSTHLAWLEEHVSALGAFGANSATSIGFGWLDENGEVDSERDRELWINCRMTHCFSLLSMQGKPQYGALADHGITAISHYFRDSEHGGFFSSINKSGEAVDTTKQAYAHAFVVLAAASATAAEREGAAELLDVALEALDQHFFEPEHRLHSDVYNREFTECEEYRGINANMHAVEALLSASAVLDRLDLLERAVGILDRAINEFARGNDWALPEHYSTDWDILKDYNKDEPAHPFRPYGATIGHWFEWARLALHAEAGLKEFGQEAPSWLREAAIALLDKGAATFGMDGEPGFVYTTDWDNTPVVSERMHWVLNEAFAAAAVAYAVTGEKTWADAYQAWWEYGVENFVNLEDHSWSHELSPTNEASAKVWAGKPDIYHALQAALIPSLPVWPPFAAAIENDLVKR